MILAVVERGWRGLASRIDRIRAALNLLPGELSVARLPAAATRLEPEQSLELACAGSLAELVDDLAERVARLTSVDAVVVWARHPQGSVERTAIGIAEELAPERPDFGPPSRHPVRAVHATFHYRPDADPPGALRSALAIPLEVGGQEVGQLVAYSLEPTMAQACVAAAEALAQAAALVVEDRQVTDAGPLVSGNHGRDHHPPQRLALLPRTSGRERSRRIHARLTARGSEWRDGSLDSLVEKPD